LSDLRHLGRGFAKRLFAFLVPRQIEKEARVFELGAILVPRIDDVFEARLLLENGLRLVAVVPEIGFGCEPVQLFDPLLLAVEVKDASAEARASLPGGSTAPWSLPTWLHYTVKPFLAQSSREIFLSIRRMILASFGERS
jgi:hypothetical protein